jgi:hypothetical protein
MLLVLAPNTIGDAQFTSSNVAEPDASSGEVAWVSGASHAVGVQRTRPTTHMVYECIVATSGTTPPEDDPTNWAEVGPTNKWAWNDRYADTLTTRATPLVITVQPGTTTAIDFYGLVGESLRIQVKDAPGGSTYFDQTYGLVDYAGPDLMWEFYFGVETTLTEFIVSGIAPNPACEVTITLSAASGNVSIGRMSFGNFESLGVPEVGFTSKPRTFSRIKTDEFGNVTIKKGRSAVDLSGSAVLEMADVNSAHATIKELLGVPVSVVPSQLTKFSFLKTFGLVEADISPISATHAKLNIKVEGIA